MIEKSVIIGYIKAAAKAAEKRQQEQRDFMAYFLKPIADDIIEELSGTKMGS
jgi:hypothetical protein